MTNNRHRTVLAPVAPPARAPLLVKDVLKHLSGLAKLYSDGSTGNADMGDGVGHVVNALRPYADSPVAELESVIAKRKLSSVSRAKPRKPQAELPMELESLGRSEVEAILGDDAYTKLQVAELGRRRFGLSQPALARSRKEDAIQSVWAALEHEKSLEAIAEEAEKAGRARLN